MVFRQAAANLLRIFRPRPSTFAFASPRPPPSTLPPPISLSRSYQNGARGHHTRRISNWDHPLWIILSGQAGVLLLGINANLVFAEDVPIQSGSNNEVEGSNIVGLEKIEDGSVVSNEHTAKWRIFTDLGRDFFIKGKLEEAEKFFLSAIQEAKEGFGERDPHVASACNNLAELYRVQKALDKAEPLYLSAISILEETYGPNDIRVAFAFHNLGKFYLMQRKLEESRRCYERALKIKGRVQGLSHEDYAETMYHLGMVMYLQGNEKDSEDFILDSIRILEEGGQGESITCMKRLRYLAQIYLKSNRPADAENVQRKILQIMELSKGWNSLDTVISAESLALTLQAVGNLMEAQELLERCLDARRTLLPNDHIQIAANMLHIARVTMLNSSQLRKMHISEAIIQLDKAKDLLENSMRIARGVIDKLMKQKDKKKKYGDPKETQTNGRAALVILLQSLHALALLEKTRQELLESREELSLPRDTENALRQCIAAYKEFGTGSLIGGSPEAKAEYLSCLKYLSSLIDTKATTSPELKEEIKHIELEISSYGFKPFYKGSGLREVDRLVLWRRNPTVLTGNGGFVVPSASFELLGDSKEFLTTYTFGTHTAKHTFCKVYGITSFYIPRSNPDGVAVTVKCVDPGTLTHVELRHSDGRDWESSYNQTGCFMFQGQVPKYRRHMRCTYHGNGDTNLFILLHPILKVTYLAGQLESCDMESESVVHQGGCHCKRVRWRVRAPSSVVVWKCDCSNCSVRGNIHFIVPSESFEVLGDSKEFLTTYTFGTHTAKHTFCKVCGITSFYFPRSNPDGVAVTVKCVDPGTLTHVELRHYDGKNWESSYNKTNIASLSKVESQNNSSQ
ncbi:hypothetical protein SLE2022_274290 [Rubroshorea leprosula]